MISTLVTEKTSSSMVVVVVGSRVWVGVLGLRPRFLRLASPISRKKGSCLSLDCNG